MPEMKGNDELVIRSGKCYWTNMQALEKSDKIQLSTADSSEAAP
jgi:hypothetical protein